LLLRVRSRGRPDGRGGQCSGRGSQAARVLEICLARASASRSACRSRPPGRDAQPATILLRTSCLQR